MYKQGEEVLRISIYYERVLYEEYPIKKTTYKISIKKDS